MNKSLPLALAAFCVAAVGYLFLAQKTAPEAPGVDPQLGRRCFELHRADLPPGSQYEGISSADHTLVIKVMDGAGVTKRECLLDPSGSISR